MRNDASHRGHVILVGPMGAGKSTLGRRLSKLLGLPFIDLDKAIETAADQSIQTIFDTEGEAGFRARETQALAQALAGDAAVIATGGGVVIAETNRKAMAAGGTVVYLQIAPEVQLARLAGDTQRPLLQHPDRAQRLALLQAEREPLYRALAHLNFNAGASTPAAAARTLAAKLLQRDSTRP